MAIEAGSVWPWWVLGTANVAEWCRCKKGWLGRGRGTTSPEPARKDPVVAVASFRREAPVSPSPSVFDSHVGPSLPCVSTESLGRRRRSTLPVEARAADRADRADRADCGGALAGPDSCAGGAIAATGGGITSTGSAVGGNVWAVDVSCGEKSLAGAWAPTGRRTGVSGRPPTPDAAAVVPAPPSPTPLLVAPPPPPPLPLPPPLLLPAR